VRGTLSMCHALKAVVVGGGLCVKGLLLLRSARLSLPPPPSSRPLLFIQTHKPSNPTLAYAHSHYHHKEEDDEGGEEVHTHLTGREDNSPDTTSSFLTLTLTSTPPFFSTNANSSHEGVPRCVWHCGMASGCLGRA